MADAFLAYCGESGQRDYGPKTDKFFVVASVLVPATDAPHLEDEIRGLKRTFWGNPDIEIKIELDSPTHRTSETLHRSPWNRSQGDRPTDICSLSLASQESPHTASRLIDKPLMQSKYVNPHYAEVEAYTKRRLLRDFSNSPPTGCEPCRSVISLVYNSSTLVVGCSLQCWSALIRKRFQNRGLYNNAGNIEA